MRLHRSGSGQRYYEPVVLSRLAFIALCQEVGFTIAEIATLLDGRPDARGRWQQLAERKLEDVDSQVLKLRQVKRHLQSALACNCGSVESCELIDAAGERRRLPLHPRQAADQATGSAGGPSASDMTSTPRGVPRGREHHRARYQPRARHSGIAGRSAPRVVSSPWPG
jgi:DNA-binding transcriptional MerR regulator